tara:strand:+ start:1320 stop:1490 length:171 start_codon:yes stop_codon:yes gene_type:complete
MIDREHDSINWGLIIVLLACAYYWVNVYYFGFFVPTMWTIVIGALIGLYFRLSGKA